MYIVLVLVRVQYEVNFTEVMPSGGGAPLTQIVQVPSAIGHPDISVKVFMTLSGVPFQSGSVLGK